MPITKKFRAEGPNFFFPNKRRSVFQKFWYFSLESYWITHKGVSRKFLELALRKFFLKRSQNFDIWIGYLPVRNIFNFRINCFEDVWNVLLMKMCMLLIL